MMQQSEIAKDTVHPQPKEVEGLMENHVDGLLQHDPVWLRYNADKGLPGRSTDGKTVNPDSVYHFNSEQVHDYIGNHPLWWIWKWHQEQKRLCAMINDNSKLVRWSREVRALLCSVYDKPTEAGTKPGLFLTETQKEERKHEFSTLTQKEERKHEVSTARHDLNIFLERALTNYAIERTQHEEDPKKGIQNFKDADHSRDRFINEPLHDLITLTCGKGDEKVHKWLTELAKSPLLSWRVDSQLSQLQELMRQIQRDHSSGTFLMLLISSGLYEPRMAKNRKRLRDLLEEVSVTSQATSLVAAFEAFNDPKDDVGKKAFIARLSTRGVWLYCWALVFSEICSCLVMSSKAKRMIRVEAASGDEKLKQPALSYSPRTQASAVMVISASEKKPFEDVEDIIVSGPCVPNVSAEKNQDIPVTIEYRYKEVEDYTVQQCLILQKKWNAKRSNMLMKFRALLIIIIIASVVWSIARIMAAWGAGRASITETIIGTVAVGLVVDIFAIRAFMRNDDSLEQADVYADLADVAGELRNNRLLVAASLLLLRRLLHYKTKNHAMDGDEKPWFAEEDHIFEAAKMMRAERDKVKPHKVPASDAHSLGGCHKVIEAIGNNRMMRWIRIADTHYWSEWIRNMSDEETTVSRQLLKSLRSSVSRQEVQQKQEERADSRCEPDALIRTTNMDSPLEILVLPAALGEVLAKLLKHSKDDPVNQHLLNVCKTLAVHTDGESKLISLGDIVVSPEEQRNETYPSAFPLQDFKTAVWDVPLTRPAHTEDILNSVPAFDTFDNETKSPTSTELYHESADEHGGDVDLRVNSSSVQSAFVLGQPQELTSQLPTLLRSDVVETGSPVNIPLWPVLDGHEAGPQGEDNVESTVSDLRFSTEFVHSTSRAPLESMEQTTPFAIKASTPTFVSKDVAVPRVEVFPLASNSQSSSQRSLTEVKVNDDSRLMSYVELDDFGDEVVNKDVMDRLFSLPLESGQDIFSVGLLGKRVSVTIRHSDTLDIEKVRDKIANVIPCHRDLIVVTSTSLSEMSIESLTGLSLCSQDLEQKHKGPHGTISCGLQTSRGESYILSCCHVMCRWKTYEKDIAEVKNRGGTSDSCARHLAHSERANPRVFPNPLFDIAAPCNVADDIKSLLRRRENADKEHSERIRSVHTDNPSSEYENIKKDLQAQLNRLCQQPCSPSLKVKWFSYSDTVDLAIADLQFPSCFTNLLWQGTVTQLHQVHQAALRTLSSGGWMRTRYVRHGKDGAENEMDCKLLDMKVSIKPFTQDGGRFLHHVQCRAVPVRTQEGDCGALLICDFSAENVEVLSNIPLGNPSGEEG